MRSCWRFTNRSEGGAVLPPLSPWGRGVGGEGFHCCISHRPLLQAKTGPCNATQEMQRNGTALPPPPPPPPPPRGAGGGPRPPHPCPPRRPDSRRPTNT